ncbi:MAG: hypothetical protein OQL11_06660 [Gammaproteobacteria bacterium]|nr:hypothetical protein [Gammaproteobacteria bacterium]
MQVRELVELGAFLKEFIQEHGLPNLYQELVNAVNQAAQNQNPGNVTTNYNRLLQVHAEADERILSPAQSKLVVDYGADKLIGKNASQRLTSIFDKHRAHPQGMVAAITEMLNETNQLAKRSNQLVSVLEPMIQEHKLDEEELGENEGRLWLYFSEAASVTTIGDLEKAADTWKQILHNFSRMPGASADGGRILQMQKHSPLELEVAANVALLVPLGFGIQWVLSKIEHVIRICQEAEKLKQLKVKSQIIKDLYQDAKEQRKTIAEEAADEIKKKYNTDGEVRNAVKQALSKIITFIEDGGKLDIDIGDKDSEAADVEGDESKIELKGFIENIRKEIKLLPSRENEAENDEDEEAAEGGDG